MLPSFPSSVTWAEEHLCSVHEVHLRISCFMLTKWIYDYGRCKKRGIV